MSNTRELLPNQGQRKQRTPEQIAVALSSNLDYPATQVGVIGNITVSYDSSLGAQGLALAQQLLNSATGPYNDMQSFFGITGSAVQVIIAPLSGKNDGSGGAYHYGCDFTSGGVLYLDATFASTTVNPLALEVGLYVAELSECFMGSQGKGWGCGLSNGEGLSRFCTEQDTPLGTLNAFTTGPAWAQAGFPDWVAKTESTDRDAVSTGCAIIYIYWMLSLGYSITQIVQAGGSTLATNYQSLTGKTSAYQDLLAAVKGLSVTSDNPFPPSKWKPWTLVPGGTSKPGAPVTGVPWGNDMVLFSVSPNGQVQQDSGEPFGEKWAAAWSLVSGGSSTPPFMPIGSPITAVPWGNRVALFATTQRGSIYMNIGYPQTDSWVGWTPVAQGSSIPGATVTAVVWGNGLVLFMADPNGGVYQSSGDPNEGNWGPWTLIPGVNVNAGSPITASPWGNRVALFVTDHQGNINQNIGYPQTDSWVGWTPVAQGSSTPGATVTAQIWGNYVVLFRADPGGGVYQSSGDPNDGSSWGSWALIPGANVKAGSPITAAISYPNSNQLALFVTDQQGSIYMNSGYPQIDSWVGWTHVAQGSFTPGGTITVAPWINGQPALFTVDTNGRIYSTSQAPPPSTPPPLPSPSRSITVTRQGTPSSTAIVVTGSGFTPNSLIVIRGVPANLLNPVQFSKTAGADGKFVASDSFSCVQGVLLTVTAFEDANPANTVSNAVQFSC